MTSHTWGSDLSGELDDIVLPEDHFDLMPGGSDGSYSKPSMGTAPLEPLPQGELVARSASFDGVAEKDHGSIAL